MKRRHITELLVSLAIVLGAAGITGELFAQADAHVLKNGRIVFSIHDDLFSMEPDGTDRIQLTSGGVSWYPQVSPNGRKIAVFGNFGSPSGIYVMDADGNNRTFLTQSSYYQYRTTMSWSPDGSRIAFTCPPMGGICIINVDGSNFAVIDDEPKDYGPDWSPDGTKIAFTRGTVNKTNHEIYLMDANGENPRRLTTNTLPDLHPRWSPDGTGITFIRLDGCGYKGGELFCFASYVYVMNASDGSGQKALYGGDALYGGYGACGNWSADGTRIVFSGSIEGSPDQDEIFSIRPVGNGLTNVTNTIDESEGCPDWGPRPVPLPTDDGYQ